MAKALAIETSGRIGSVALCEEGHVVEERQFPHGLRHAAGIVPMIDEMCRSRGWTARDLGELYVSAGPGSFTGLRIGITLAKVLAFATGAKVVAVPTVRVLLGNAPEQARNVLIVLDARREQIYTARFARSPVGWEEHEPAHLDWLGRALARCPRPVYLLGEGIPYHRQAIPADDEGILVTGEEAWRARASCVAEIGSEMARRGEYTVADRLTPLYIRPPEAEEKWQAAQGQTVPK